MAPGGLKLVAAIKHLAVKIVFDLGFVLQFTFIIHITQARHLNSRNQNG